MKLFHRLAVLGLALATPSMAFAGDTGPWYADFDKAVAAAKAEKKDLLVDFTGSDWCGWCKKLDAEVFSHKEFLDFAAKELVLVALDFPRDEAIKAKVPNPERNKELQRKYGVQGFPTIFLMTADGDVLAQTGYQAGGPEKYVASLTKMRADGRKALVDVKDIVTKFEAATGDEKTKQLDRAITTLESFEEGSPFARQLTPIARSAFTSDAENKSGHKLRALKALLKSGEFDAELDKAGRQLDPKNELGVLEKVIAGQLNAVDSEQGVRDAIAAITDVDKLGIKDAELKLHFYASAAFMNFQHLDDKEAAKVWAEKLKAIAPDDKKFQQIYKMILG